MKPRRKQRRRKRGHPTLVAWLLSQLSEIPTDMLPIELLPYDMQEEISRLNKEGRGFTVFEVTGAVDDHNLSRPLILVPHLNKRPPYEVIRQRYYALRKRKRKGQA